jgi:hypothetical protein
LFTSLEESRFGFNRGGDARIGGGGHFPAAIAIVRNARSGTCAWPTARSNCCQIVFTLGEPPKNVEIAFQNKCAVYAILIKAEAETLSMVAADPRHLRTEADPTTIS